MKIFNQSGNLVTRSPIKLLYIGILEWNKYEQLEWYYRLSLTNGLSTPKYNLSKDVTENQGFNIKNRLMNKTDAYFI